MLVYIKNLVSCIDTGNTILTPNIEKKETVVPDTNELTAAPKKINQKSVSKKSKKKLFKGDDTKCTEEIISLMPSILKKLQKAGHLTDLSNLLRLIAADKFPLNNISFLLLLEVER